MAEVTIYLVDAFTATPGEGNRAGVVFDAGHLSVDEMQAIAAFANVSETAFLINANAADDYDLHVRYFTPSTEVPICGHATIASHFLRSLKLNLPSGRVMAKTGAGILPVDIERTNDDIKIIMTQGKPEIGDILNEDHIDEALSALGLLRNDLIEDLPVQSTSTGHGKVIIPIKEVEKLHQLTPDKEALKRLTKKIGHTGYFVMTIHDDGPYKTHGRMFAPAIGIDEDPVTGNGNGPAGLYMAHHGVLDFDKSTSYYGIQGEEMGKPGVIEVRVFKEKNAISKIQVAGSAVEAGQLKYNI